MMGSLSTPETEATKERADAAVDAVMRRYLESRGAFTKLAKSQRTRLTNEQRVSHGRG